MFTEADRTLCRAIKSAAGGGKLTGQHSANQVEDLNTMFAAAMSELANAVEESIRAVINNKFKNNHTGWRGGRQRWTSRWKDKRHNVIKGADQHNAETARVVTNGERVKHHQVKHHQVKYHQQHASRYRMQLLQEDTW